MSRERMPLPAGTLVSFDSGSTYLITGAPVGYGGGSILYPARKQCGTSSDGIGYVLKECYPVSTGHLFHRDDRGEIVPDSGDEEDIQFLQRAKSLQLTEGVIGQKIYQKASRMIPIRDSSQIVSFTFPDHSTSEAVDNTFTVMDALTEKGRSLSEWVAERRRFAPAEAFRIVQQLLFALREVHQAGYLHLDIQDGNIFLRGTLQEKDELVTLIDFGCARELINGKTAPIRDKVIYTTQGFFAPEILLHNDGNLQLGPEADIFSVGCLALFLLTGQRANVRELMETRTGIYLKPNQFRRIKCPKHLAETLQRILAKALAKKPEDRYNCVDAMLTDVTELVDALQPYRSDLRTTQFDAFVCYKHGPVDSAAALAVQRALENYRAPKGICETKKPFKRVFVDEGELSSCADFGQQIQDALRNSGWLIVICSPDTPLSPWVQKEIDTFLEYHDRSRILALLTGGSPDQSFPPQLQGNKGGEGEVFAAHALGATVQEVIKKIRGDSLLKLVAPMIGTTYDALKQRHKIYRLQRLAMITAGFLVAAMGFGAYAINRANVIAQQAIRIEEEYERALVNESLFLSEQAEKMLVDNPVNAMELALKALPSDTQDRPILTEAEYVLGKALGVYTTPCMAEDTVTAVGVIDTEYSDFLLSDDGKYVFAWGYNATGVGSVIECWDAESLALRWVFPLENSIRSHSIISSVGNLYVRTALSVHSICVETGEENWYITSTDFDEKLGLSNTYNTVESFSLSDDESELLVIYGESGDYFGVPNEEGTCELVALSVSAETGEVLHNIPFQLDRNQSIDSDMYISPDSHYVALHTSHENEEFFWSSDSVYLLDLKTGICDLLFQSDTQIQAMIFADDRLAVIRADGYIMSVESTNSVYEYYDPYARCMEVYDVVNRSLMWSQELHGYYETEGITRILETPYHDGTTSGRGLLFVAEAHCILMDAESGDVIRHYTFPSPVLTASLTQKGFEAILADGSYVITGFGIEQYQRIEFWGEDISAIYQKDDQYFIRRTKNYAKDYRIYKYQKNKWDDTYTMHDLLDNTSWRVVASGFSKKDPWVMLSESFEGNRVCLMNVNSEERWMRTIPESYGFYEFRAIGTSSKGDKLYWTGDVQWDDSAGWISSGAYYVLDFQTGEIQKIVQPPEPYEYISEIDTIFHEDKLFILACRFDVEKDILLVYCWNMVTNEMEELWSTTLVQTISETDGKRLFDEAYVYESLSYSMENNRLRFVLYDDCSEGLTRIISLDTESRAVIEIPVSIQLQGGGDMYKSWVGGCHQWNASETQAMLCYNDHITIVDIEGQTVCDIPVTDQTVSAQFSPDECYLLTVTQKGVLSMYRISDAAKVASINLTDYDAELSSIDEETWVWEFLDENTLLGVGGTTGYLVNISQESLVMKATIDQCVGYDSHSDRFVVAGGDSNAGINVAIGSFPRYTVEDLIRKANAILYN